MNLRKTLAVSAALVMGAGLTACGGGSSGPSGGNSSGGAVAMTFWHNSTTGDGKPSGRRPLRTSRRPTRM